MYLNNTRQWCRLAERGYLSYFSLSLFLSFLRLVIWVLLHRNSSAILGCQSLCPIGSNSVKLTPRQETGEKENGSAPMIDGKNRKRDVDKMWSRDVGRKDSKRLGGRSVRSIGDHLILVYNHQCTRHPTFDIRSQPFLGADQDRQCSVLSGKIGLRIKLDTMMNFSLELKPAWILDSCNSSNRSHPSPFSSSVR